ncbi:M15 family metallopeptidase [Deinococcus sp.]|uniref:M15 family metallopeptidase n=1 Tax=Deinococcus sp. TaxID=47478 RepID=UPI00344B1C3A
MSSELARAAAQRTRPTILAALMALCVVSAAALGHNPLTAPSPPPLPIAAPPPPPRLPVRLHGNRLDAAGRAAGAVPDGVTVFDDRYPAVARLNADLLRALRHAATDATDDGVTFFVNSGWRSRSYQNQLLHEAVSKYGSEAEAARWVATADTSPHVSGDAVDIGPARAAAWLSKYGTRYGLCQIYRNESWHFELRPRAIVRGCPPMYADPTHDPRMR